jgi:hypothetical protein
MINYKVRVRKRSWPNVRIRGTEEERESPQSGWPVFGSLEYQARVLATGLLRHVCTKYTSENGHCRTLCW